MMKEVTEANQPLKVGLGYEIASDDYFWMESTAPAGVKRQSRSRSRDRGHHRISLLYFGTITRILKDSAAAISGPALLLLERGEIPVYSLSADCLLVSLCFRPELLDKQHLSVNIDLNRTFMHSIVPLAGADIEAYHKYFNLIIHAYRRKDAKATQEIVKLLVIVFNMIANSKVGTEYLEDLPASRLTYFRFKALIEQDFKKQHQVQAYADQLCMTAEMLGKMVKETVCKTPKQLIDERLITEAKRMLHWSRKTNKEIAYDLGFETDSYFNRFFKKHCQQTPLSYRLQMQR